MKKVNGCTEINENRKHKCKLSANSNKIRYVINSQVLRTKLHLSQDQNKIIEIEYFFLINIKKKLTCKIRNNGNNMVI